MALCLYMQTVQEIMLQLNLRQHTGNQLNQNNILAGKLFPNIIR